MDLLALWGRRPAKNQKPRGFQGVRSPRRPWRLRGSSNSPRGEFSCSSVAGPAVLLPPWGPLRQVGCRPAKAQGIRNPKAGSPPRPQRPGNSSRAGTFSTRPGASSPRSCAGEARGVAPLGLRAVWAAGPLRGNSPNGSRAQESRASLAPVRSSTRPGAGASSPAVYGQRRKVITRLGSGCRRG